MQMGESEVHTIDSTRWGYRKYVKIRVQKGHKGSGEKQRAVRERGGYIK